MGTLFVVATPIGNLEDIAFRAIRILKEVDLVLCEDTRQTKKLLDRYQIVKPLGSLFEQNEMSKVLKIIKLLQDGRDIALVTDAGTPLISDPGYRLVKAAIEKGIKIVPIPGPSAPITALVASGLPTDSFVFVGFLPAKEGQRKNFLEKLKNEERTIVAFESPERLVFSLQSILEVLGDRTICVAREMTKIHEEFFRGTITATIKHFSQSKPRGEVTLVIGR